MNVPELQAALRVGVGRREAAVKISADLGCGRWVRLKSHGPIPPSARTTMRVP
jgi:hypothetical protein